MNIFEEFSRIFFIICEVEMCVCDKEKGIV